MPRRPLFVLICVLGVLLASACSSERASDRQAIERPATSGDLIYAYSWEDQREIHVLAAQTGSLVRTIPWGTLDPLAAVLHRVEFRDGGSILRTFDDKSGSLVRERTLAGPYLYALPELGPFDQPVGLSPNGRWLALRARGVDYVTTSAFLVVDTTGQTPDLPIELQGNFGFDAIADSGQLLYLEEHLPAKNPTGYRVRAYDIPSRSLLEGAVIDKTVQVDQMRGSRVTSVASDNGEWVHSLYLSYDGGQPFIHALNLPGRYSVCLFLPNEAGGNTEADLAWSLVPAPGGKTAYIVNAIQGVLVDLDLVGAKFRRTATFRASRAPDPLESLARWFVPVAEAKSEMFAQGVVSPDGKSLYLLGEFGHGIVAISTDTLAVTRRFSTNAAMLTGIGLSPDGSAVYVTDEGRSIMRVDLGSGEVTAANAARPHRAHPARRGELAGGRASPTATRRPPYLVPPLGRRRNPAGARSSPSSIANRNGGTS